MLCVLSTNKYVFVKKPYMMTRLGVQSKIMSQVPGVSVEYGEMTRKTVDNPGRYPRW